MWTKSVDVDVLFVGVMTKQESFSIKVIFVDMVLRWNIFKTESLPLYTFFIRNISSELNLWCFLSLKANISDLTLPYLNIMCLKLFSGWVLSSAEIKFHIHFNILEDSASDWPKFQPHLSYKCVSYKKTQCV